MRAWSSAYAVGVAAWFARINARIRLIQRRGFGIRDVDSLTMIYLCLGGITITLAA